MAKRYRSRIAETVHKTAEGLQRLGAIDKTTMREFDVMCLTLVENLSAREIQRIRKQAGVSQEVFSKYLNVPVTLVSQWGTRREEAVRPVAQAAVPGQAEGAADDRVTVLT